MHRILHPIISDKLYLAFLVVNLILTNCNFQVLSTTYHVNPNASQQYNSQRTTQSLFHVFQEFPTTTQRTLTCVIIELLVLPLEPTEVTSQLINVVFDSLRSFSTTGSIGLFLASLPTPFHGYLYEKAITILKQDPLLLEDGSVRLFPN